MTTVSPPGEQRQRGAARSRVARRHVVAVLDTLLSQGPMWRAELAERTGLSRATVTRLTTELLGAGIISEEAAVRARAPQPGRPRTLLKVNPQAGGLVGADIGGSHVRAAAADLRGTIVLRRVRPSTGRDGRPVTVAALVRLLHEVTDRAGAKGMPIKGIGVGVPGLATDEGVVVNAPVLGWTDVPLRAILEEEFGSPAVVESDVNLAAAGEFALGAGAGAQALAVVMVGTGVGAGIVLDGRLYRGVHWAGAEIGHLLLDRKSLDRGLPGHGCFERLIGAAGITDRARRALVRAQDPERASWPLDLATLTAADVFSRRSTSRLAARIVDETVDYLALGVANIACVLNPDRIVLGGPVIHNNPYLVEAVRARLGDKLPCPPSLVPAALGEDAGVIGAIVLAQGGAFGRSVLAGAGSSPPASRGGAAR